MRFKSETFDVVQTPSCLARMRRSCRASHRMDGVRDLGFDRILQLTHPSIHLNLQSIDNFAHDRPQDLLLHYRREDVLMLRYVSLSTSIQSCVLDPSQSAAAAISCGVDRHEPQHNFRWPTSRGFPQIIPRYPTPCKCQIIVAGGPRETEDGRLRHRLIDRWEYPLGLRISRAIL